MANNVSILFVSLRGVIPFIVSVGTLSRWNHCALRVNDLVYEMTTEGLKKKRYDEYIKTFKVDEIDISFFSGEINGWQITNIDKSQVKMEKREYDWVRTIGWVGRKIVDLGSDNKINCVEHVYFSLKSIGITFWNGENISPAKFRSIVKRKKKDLIKESTQKDKKEKETWLSKLLVVRKKVNMKKLLAFLALLLITESISPQTRILICIIFLIF